MKQEHVLNLMDNIDPALVEEVELTGRKKRRLSAPLRAGLVAACVCLALVGSALAVDAIWGVRLTNFIGQGEETGYQVLVDTAQRVSLDSLPQAVLDLPRREFMDLGSVEEAEKLLGISLPGFAVFQGLDRSMMTFSIGYGEPGTEPGDIREEDMTRYRTYCYLQKIGPDSDPNIISVTAQYVQEVVMPREGASAPDRQVIYFDVTANLITESMPYSAFGGLMSTDGSIQMEQSSFIASDGQEVPLISLVIPSTGKADGEETETNLAGACAYYVQEGVIYRVVAHGWRTEDDRYFAVTTDVLREALESVLTSAQPVAP